MKANPIAGDDLLYKESISSKKTLLLFAVLAAVFLLLSVWRAAVRGFDPLAGTLAFFCLFFLFYVINFRTLQIRITSQVLQLKFGVFSWTVPFENIAACRLDDLPKGMAMGGAGVHFMFIHRRYRASFNFLEYPRVVVGFRKKVGPVADLSFSTRRPEEIVRLVEENAALDGNP
jgi:hypothetical protein